MSLVPLILLVGLYLAFVVPQRRRARAREAELAALGAGDRVLLTSGVHGIIVEVRGATLVVQVAPGTPLHVVKAGIMRKVGESEPGIPTLDELGVDLEDPTEEPEEAPAALEPGEREGDAA